MGWSGVVWGGVVWCGVVWGSVVWWLSALGKVWPALACAGLVLEWPGVIWIDFQEELV